MRVLAAMSGGVDSAVAAALLLEAGHEVVGLTLRLFGPDDGADVAASVAAKIGIQAIQTAAASANRPEGPMTVLRTFTLAPPASRDRQERTPSAPARRIDDWGDGTLTILTNSPPIAVFPARQT